MKRYLFSFVILIFPLIVVSQVDYGLKAGPTLSWYRSSTYGEIIPDYKSLAGFQAGFFAEAKLNRYFSLQPELLVSSRGAKVEYYETFTVPYMYGYTTVRLGFEATMAPLYLDLPVYIKAGFPASGSDRFMVGAGPVLSYGLSGNAKIKVTVGDVSYYTEKVKLFSEDGFDLEEIEWDFRILERFDVAVAGFAAYEFSNKVMLSINYQYGLKNISEDPDEELKNRSVSVTLGYRL